jgi:hypothetical protein
MNLLKWSLATRLTKVTAEVNNIVRAGVAAEVGQSRLWPSTYGASTMRFAKPGICRFMLWPFDPNDWRAVDLFWTEPALSQGGAN